MQNGWWDWRGLDSMWSTWWLVSESLLWITSSTYIPNVGIESKKYLLFRSESCIEELVITRTPREMIRDTNEEALPCAVETRSDKLKLSVVLLELENEEKVMKRNRDHTFKLGPELKDDTTFKHHENGDEATTPTENVIKTRLCWRFLQRTSWRSYHVEEETWGKTWYLGKHKREECCEAYIEETCVCWKTLEKKTLRMLSIVFVIKTAWTSSISGKYQLLILNGTLIGVFPANRQVTLGIFLLGLKMSSLADSDNTKKYRE